MQKLLLEFPYSIQLSASFPYVSALSKNQKEIYTKNYTRKKIKNPAHEKMKNVVYQTFSSKRKKQGLEFDSTLPVFVLIAVHRKIDSSDAHNFAEGICDALEGAIGVNDRKFTVYSIPLINKKNPRIDVEVYQ